MMIDKQTGDMKGITEIIVDDSAAQHTGETDDMTRMVFDLFHEYESSDHRKAKLEEYKQSRESYDGHRPAKEFPWKNCSNYPSNGIPACALNKRCIASTERKPRKTKRTAETVLFLSMSPIVDE